MPTMMAWMLGYLVYNLTQLVVFLAGRSPTELDRMRCATGFTAYTPNYPEGQDMGQIFATTPYSPLGVALLVTAVFLTRLSCASYNMVNRAEKKRLMTQLHRLIRKNRLLHQRINVYHLSKTSPDQARIHARAPDRDKLAEDRVDLDKVDRAIKELQEQENDHLDTILAMLSERDEELKVHQNLVTARIKANLFMELLRENERDYYAIAIGLSFETVIDAVTEYCASCKFSHSVGSPDYESCMKDSPLDVSLRVLLSDFIGAIGFLVVIVTVIKLVHHFNLNAVHEHEHHPDAESDSSTDEDAAAEERYHDRRHAPALFSPRAQAAKQRQQLKQQAQENMPNQANVDANPLAPFEEGLCDSLLDVSSHH